MNLIGVLKLLGITAGITAIVGLCCLASRELCSPTKRRGEVSKWGNSRTWAYRRERRPPQKSRYDAWHAEQYGHAPSSYTNSRTHLSTSQHKHYHAVSTSASP